MLLFKDYHIYPIISDDRAIKKVHTRRVWKKSRVKVGSWHQARTQMLVKESMFARVAVTDVYQQTLGDMVEEDAVKEGGYTLEQFKFCWYIVNKEIFNPNLKVWVVEFEDLKTVKLHPMFIEDARKKYLAHMKNIELLLESINGAKKKEESEEK